MDIISAQAIMDIDSYAIEALKMPSTLLMENAAKKVAEQALALIGGQEGVRAAVFCGSGNNGGDGVAVARILKSHGIETRCFLVGKREKMTPDAREMEARLNGIGGAVEDFALSGDGEDYIRRCGLIIDAIFGVGLNSNLRENALEAVKLINRSGAKVVSVDIASGVDSDTGRILGGAVRADLTVTFSFAKMGHIAGPGGRYCGRLEVADIGIPRQALDSQKPFATAVDEAFVDSVIPIRPRDAHKGDFGKVLLVCGSVGYVGAAVMAAKSALRTGSGLVFLAVPDRIYDIAAVKCSDEIMVLPFESDENGRFSANALPLIRSKLEQCDACLIGPGLGQSDGLYELVRALIGASKIPLVIDADGINLISRNIDILRGAVCPIVLTPHAREFERLGGDREGWISAKSFARQNGVTLVLKGHRTVTASPGGHVYVNTTGNPGMATGGSGDVLAGMIVSLIGQKLELERAVPAAVWLHGKAGDVGARKLGEYGLTPTDLIGHIPIAMKKYGMYE